MPRQGRSAFSLLQLLFSVLGHAAVAAALPAAQSSGLLSTFADQDEPKSTDDPSLYIYLGTAIALVLLGGAFAGLTIALMGQDEIYLQVIATSGEGPEKRNATKVLRLLKKGKHWVLVTLLVGNVITNETLPIVLDRSIGGGYAAAITSTVLVIVFGEIVPQSICVRYGLPIGAWMSPFVLVLMWIFAPVSWPIAKLLDRLLGEDHGTTYKKAGLKTLVTLHKTIGPAPGDRLNQDEVSIISGVLDLKAKSVGSIMTPMNDVFTLSADAVLDEDMIYLIMSEGYSRIPIHQPKNKFNFVGMLLVKMLITYDPEDAKRVDDFSLATLPETRPETSCLDIINFFQEGKSHMVLVSDFPGQNFGALGVVTLEDVIEELIGEEIIDESDVFIDVPRAIRRMQPAPIQRPRVPQGEIVTDPIGVGAQDEDTPDGEDTAAEEESEGAKANGSRKSSFARNQVQRSLTTADDVNKSQQAATVWLRRRSSQSDTGERRVPLTAETRAQLSHLGPSNAASRPKQTRISTVKIKPSVGTIPEDHPLRPHSSADVDFAPASSGEGGHGLVYPGHSAKDGVRAVQAGFSSWDGSARWQGLHRTTSAGQTLEGSGSRTNGYGAVDEHEDMSVLESSQRQAERRTARRSDSHSTLGSMHGGDSDESDEARAQRQRAPSKRGTTRSGSITEQFVDSGGIKKLVLEMTSSSSDADDGHKGPAGAGDDGRLRPGGPSKSGASSQRSVATASSADGDDKNAGDKKKKKRRGSRRHQKQQHRRKDHHDDADGRRGPDEKSPLLGHH